MLRLDFTDAVNDLVDRVDTWQEVLRRRRKVIGLFLEDECGKSNLDVSIETSVQDTYLQSNNIFRLVLCEDILKNAFGQDKFVRRMNLACHFALERDTRLFINKT